MVTINKSTPMPDDADPKPEKAFTIDEERKVIVYNPLKTNDITIGQTILSMLNIAQQNNMPVEVNFNDVVFQVTPGMKPLDGLKKYITAYRHSPQYAETLQKRRKELAEVCAVNDLISGNQLDVTGFTHAYQLFLSNPYIPRTTKAFLNRWGKLMQVEQKLHGMSDLTLDFIDRTANRAAIGLNITREQVNEAYAWLTIVWAQGEKLAQITHADMSTHLLSRKLGSDQANNLYKTYQPPKSTDPVDRAQSAADLLATVLQSEKLIDKFVTETRDGTLKWNELIPVLELPKDKHQKDLFLNMTAYFAKQKLQQNNPPDKKRPGPEHS